MQFWGNFQRCFLFEIWQIKNKLNSEVLNIVLKMFWLSVVSSISWWKHFSFSPEAKLCWYSNQILDPELLKLETQRTGLVEKASKW